MLQNLLSIKTISLQYDYWGRNYLHFCFKHEFHHSCLWISIINSNIICKLYHKNQFKVFCIQSISVTRNLTKLTDVNVSYEIVQNRSEWLSLVLSLTYLISISSLSDDRLRFSFIRLIFVRIIFELTLLWVIVGIEEIQIRYSQLLLFREYSFVQFLIKLIADEL